MELVDLRLSSNLRFLAIGAINVIQTCIIISISTPLFIAVIIPIFIIYFLILVRFGPSLLYILLLRDISSTVPVSSSAWHPLQEVPSILILVTLSRYLLSLESQPYFQGAATIRAFRWSESFKKQNKERVRIIFL